MSKPLLLLKIFFEASALRHISRASLLNVFLHYVLDLWFARIVVPRVRGVCHLVRYVDDFICLTQHAEGQVYPSLPSWRLPTLVQVSDHAITQTVNYIPNQRADRPIPDTTKITRCQCQWRSLTSNFIFRNRGR
jgi:hypothetical protein